jgi:hypothetical protein
MTTAHPNPIPRTAPVLSPSVDRLLVDFNRVGTGVGTRVGTGDGEDVVVGAGVGTRVGLRVGGGLKVGDVVKYAHLLSSTIPISFPFDEDAKDNPTTAEPLEEAENTEVREYP